MPLALLTIVASPANACILAGAPTAADQAGITPHLVHLFNVLLLGVHGLIQLLLQLVYLRMRDLLQRTLHNSSHRRKTFRFMAGEDIMGQLLRPNRVSLEYTIAPTACQQAVKLENSKVVKYVQVKSNSAARWSDLPVSGCSHGSALPQSSHHLVISNTTAQYVLVGKEP